MSFFNAFTSLMVAEGGYANDKLDRGGETYCGISRVSHPGWPGWILVDQCLATGDRPPEYEGILFDMVQNFYRDEYWEKPGCALIDKISQRVAEELFEAGVNCGRKNGGKFLQEALNMLNNNQTLYGDLIVDGSVGQKTAEALKMCLKQKYAEELVVRCQNGEQYAYYKNNPQHERYRGWFARTR
jgi:lysozyme family protein